MEEGAAAERRGGGGAEAVLNLQPNSSVSIAYHTLFGPHDDVLLLEIDDKLLPHVLHNRVTVRGQPNEDAVLCTPSTTYALKFVGTSNSVFLIPPSEDHSFSSDGNDIEESSTAVASVIKVAPGVMELVEVAPKLDKLRSLLAYNLYSGDEDTMEGLVEMGENCNFGLYRWEDLADRVQASDKELREGLRALFAVEVFGYWRIVDETYMGTVLNMLLHNSVLNGWSLDALNEDEVVNVLQSDGFPRDIARHCLKMYGNRVENEVGGDNLWKLVEKQVCVHFARSVLSEGKMKMEVFMEKWTQKIPVGMTAGFEMLEGEVLLESLGVETWVRSFSVSSLPFTATERFAALFRERPKWEWKDLEPYIRDLRVPGLSAEGLLLKYTRRTQPNLDVEPVFSAR